MCRVRKMKSDDEESTQAISSKEKVSLFWRHEPDGACRSGHRLRETGRNPAEDGFTSGAPNRT